MTVANTHSAPAAAYQAIALIGHPNVGKSAIFNQLTGQRVVVSNYPGTTVEIARSHVRDLPDMVLVDTPGVITFPSTSEDEQVTARVLLEEPLTAILQVGDSKNLGRTLNLTLQLAELGLPLVLALNMADEARLHHVTIDTRVLAERLRTAVVSTTAVRGQGIPELRQALLTAIAPEFQLVYPAPIEAALAEIQINLPEAPIRPRALALLWLGGDPTARHWVENHLPAHIHASLRAVEQALAARLGSQVIDILQKTRYDAVNALLFEVQIRPESTTLRLRQRLSNLTTHPMWGLGILAIVLYGLYWFVGVLGAGILVGWLEENLFGQYLNPWIIGMVETWIPFPLIQELLVGEYGLWTMGMTYALALILPIVSTFFLAFGVLEDSGYLPRLAALSNRMFEKLGLNGKAVLPMVLGLGCVTMATLTTRVLETRRERLLTILLLALAVPCSAQLGVVMGLLAGVSLGATLIWSAVVVGVFLAVGWLAARLVPGERSRLLVELPPLRIPMASNVLIKTLARLEWYLKEVVPLFLIGTLIMFSLDITGILDWLIRAAQPLVSGWLGLPPEASAAFLMGFMRRDFGATGLFVLESQGMLSPAQIVTAMVTITLFIPCVASVMMIAKERGWRTATAITLLVFPLAVFIGGLVFRFLSVIGWGG